MLGWVDDTARAGLAAAARRHGRELAALAYLVLQNRTASEEAAAAGLADVLCNGSNPAWSATVGATLRRALETHQRIHEVDAPGEATPPALTRLSPLQRAIAGAHLVAAVPLAELAPPLGLPLARLRRELAAAEELDGGQDDMRRALDSALSGRAFAVTAEEVEAATSRPPPRSIESPRHRL